MLWLGTISMLGHVHKVQLNLLREVIYICLTEIMPLHNGLVLGIGVLGLSHPIDILPILTLRPSSNTFLCIVTSVLSIKATPKTTTWCREWSEKSKFYYTRNVSDVWHQDGVNILLKSSKTRSLLFKMAELSGLQVFIPNIDCMAFIRCATGI